MQVILFKSVADENASGPEKDKFQLALEQSSFHPTVIPTLSFDFCNLEQLAEKLRKPEDYSGIIFSSPRCVQACKKSLKSSEVNSSPELASWNDKFAFAVGRATSQAINDEKFPSKIVQSDDENSESLGSKIIDVLKLKSSTDANLPLLYPCGNLRKETLQRILQSSGISTDIVTCYETVEHPELKDAFSKIVLGSNDPFVYFSPSGVSFTMPYVKHRLENRRLIAIGSTTEEALLKLEGVEKINVFKCDNPSPEALICVLNEIAEIS